MFDTVSSKVSSTISGNRKILQMFFVVLILIEFAPFDALGPRVEASLKSVLHPVMNPVSTIMSHAATRLLVFVVLLWSCCVRKDMNLFFLVAMYFVISRK